MSGFGNASAVAFQDGPRSCRVALLGFGTVGRGFMELLARESARIRRRWNLSIEVGAVLVRDGERVRSGIDADLLTTSAVDVIDGDCDLIVELVGGTTCAGAYVRRALSRGIPVVTANKALLAAEGDSLFAMARRMGTSIGFEASVCGGVPIVAALQRGFNGDCIEEISGILNGTSNFILTRMLEDRIDYEPALRLAQSLGFAEADAELDVSGHDAAQKLEILAALGVPEESCNATVVSGCIQELTARDLDIVRREGGVLRQVATARRAPGGFQLSVALAQLGPQDRLAGIRNEQNAVRVIGSATGEVMFSGKGAGALPTAASVLSDVIAIANGRM